MYRLFVLYEQFYKNNEAQICPKIKNKLRTIEARLQMQIKFNCKFLLKNIKHHVIICGVSLQIFKQL